MKNVSKYRNVIGFKLFKSKHRTKRAARRVHIWTYLGSCGPSWAQKVAKGSEGEGEEAKASEGKRKGKQKMPSGDPSGEGCSIRIKGVTPSWPPARKAHSRSCLLRTYFFRFQFSHRCLMAFWSLSSKRKTHI